MVLFIAAMQMPVRERQRERISKIERERERGGLGSTAPLINPAVWGAEGGALFFSPMKECLQMMPFVPSPGYY